MATDPNATSLSVHGAIGKDTHGGMTQKFGKAQQLPILIRLHSTERNDGHDSTGLHDICASDLCSGMCDGQLVVHRQISTDPHRTYINRNKTQGLGGCIGCYGCKTFSNGFSRKIQEVTLLARCNAAPLKHCKYEWISIRILTTPPSDSADASVIVKVPPDWLKLPSST